MRLLTNFLAQSSSSEMNRTVRVRAAQIEVADIVAGRKLGGRPRRRHSAILQNDAMMSVAKHKMRVLLGEQEAHAFVLIQPLDDLARCSEKCVRCRVAQLTWALAVGTARRRT